MTIQTKPLVMGGLMGLMMLWMLHGQLTGNAMSGPALMLFIGAHVMAAAVLIGAGIFAARLSPRLRRWTDRLHQSSFRHLGWMLTGAFLSAGAVHLLIHGAF